MNWKKVRFVLLVLALLGTFAFGLVETREAIAVGPCDTLCDDPATCVFQKCVCYTPEWGTQVSSCTRCPWAANNACT